jgi:hypothetical protein
MITSRTTILIVALFTPALVGWTVGKANQEGPAIATASSAAASPAGEASDQRPVIVLLRDGRIVKGVLSIEDGVYNLTQPVGVMRFPEKRVEKVFGSILDVYNHKLLQLPENDFDEGIKFARWCLEQKLEPEARRQLDAILKRSPKHGQARAMLAALDQAQARLANRLRDPAVQQTAGNLVRALDGERPSTLDNAIIYGARRGMGISDLPVIFDLPTSQAVKRTDEFAHYVHPVLQAYCARCHNESYEGKFQLVQIKSKQERTRDALRANLDATLKLVDRDYPPRSELLASSLRPHGRGPNMRPIFQGSNDRAYQILATWVNKLRAAGGSEDAARSKQQQTSPAIEPGESFASQRVHATEETEPAGKTTGPFVTGPVINKTLPPVRVVPGKGLVADTSVDPNEFPLPFAASGTKARIDNQAMIVQSPNAKAVKPGGAAANDPAGSGRVTAESAAPGLKKAGFSYSTDMNTKAVPASGSNDGRAAEETVPAMKKPRKPLNLDPAILQRALQLRNQGRQE